MKRFSTVAAFAALFVAGGASAHHSYAGYDACKSFTIAGEIERISWVNPHVVFTVKVDDTQSYLVQWESVSRLMKAGVHSSALSVGDRVVVVGSAHRDPAVHIVTLVTNVRRLQDGWEWSERKHVPDRCR